MKRNFQTLFISLLIALFTISCSSPYYNTYEGQTSLKASFSHMRQASNAIYVFFEATLTLPNGQKMTRKRGSVGTAFNVYSNDKYTDVMTAGHICSKHVVKLEQEQQGMKLEVTSKMHILDYAGTKYTDVRVLKTVHNRTTFEDACVVRVNKMVNQAVVKLTERVPAYGDIVHYIGNPDGIYNKEWPLLFDGHWVGPGKRDRNLATIPLTGGASGAMVFDRYGYVVGMIVETRADFKHVGYLIKPDVLIKFYGEALKEEVARELKDSKDSKPASTPPSQPGNPE